MEHWPGRGTDQPAEDDQAADVRPRRIPPPARPRAAVYARNIRRTGSMIAPKLRKSPLLPSAEGRRRKAVRTFDKPYSYGIAISADRQSVILPLVDQTSSNLMLVENFR